MQMTPGGWRVAPAVAGARSCRPIRSAFEASPPPPLGLAPTASPCSFSNYGGELEAANDPAEALLAGAARSGPGRHAAMETLRRDAARTSDLSRPAHGPRRSDPVSGDTTTPRSAFGKPCQRHCGRTQELATLLERGGDQPRGACARRRGESFDSPCCALRRPARRLSGDLSWTRSSTGSVRPASTKASRSAESEADELADLVVANPLLEDEPTHERLADTQVGRCCGNVQQGGRLSSRGAHIELLSRTEGGLSRRGPGGRSR